jgi:hypothetical protein
MHGLSEQWAIDNESIQRNERPAYVQRRPFKIELRDRPSQPDIVP